jgi:UDP-N-acetylmuramoyl-L-alanyl-D-glutamate--2,6-diaminopimelate ligase
MMAARKIHGRTLRELLGAAAGGYGSLEITDLVLDSRQVTPGAAFVALPGARTHVLNHVGEAFARGAAVVLYAPGAAHVMVPGPSVAVPDLEHRLGELARAFFGAAPETLIGVTGTNGKTTVAFLLAQALHQPRHACAYIGTLGFGVPPDLAAHALTTPDCLTLHREIAQLGTPRVAMEVSSHALARDRIAGLTFHTAVFTNLTRDHLDEHGDFARYGRAKARLFELPTLAHAVLNADDPFSASLAQSVVPGCELVRTSTRGAPGADLTAAIERSSVGGLTLALGGRFGAGRLVSKLIGDFNAENLLVALGALLAHGMPLAVAVEALGAARGAPGRMEVLGGPPEHPWVVIDYAHTPDALERVLTMLRGIATGDVWCVFGCGGERDRGKRPLMGGVAAALADRVVLTDDNPRGEDPAAIVSEIRAGCRDATQVSVNHDRRAAIGAAIARAGAGDVVLVAGKGHESEQWVGSERRPFSDRAVAVEALGGRR